MFTMSDPLTANVSKTTFSQPKQLKKNNSIGYFIISFLKSMGSGKNGYVIGGYSKFGMVPKKK